MTHSLVSKLRYLHDDLGESGYMNEELRSGKMIRVPIPEIVLIRLAGHELYKFTNLVQPADYSS